MDEQESIKKAIRINLKTSEYCNRWGNSQPMEYLFKNIMTDNFPRKTAATISRIFHRYNFYFNQISKSNIPLLIKYDVLLDLVHKNKKIIFADTKILSRKSQNAIFYHVITKFRQWKRKKIDRLKNRRLYEPHY